jgi:hypothetical protein
MHDGLLATIVRLLRWQELAMTNLWWRGCGWECLAWMHDGLLAAIVRLLRWQDAPHDDFFSCLSLNFNPLSQFFPGHPVGYSQGRIFLSLLIAQTSIRHPRFFRGIPVGDSPGRIFLNLPIAM